MTQGKTFKGDEEGRAAANAVDKDLSTHAVTATENGAGWLELEFDKTYFIKKVVMYYRFLTNWFSRGGTCSVGERAFKQCVDYENNVHVSVYQGNTKQKSCGIFRFTYGLKQSDQIYTMPCNTEGDTVKLSKSYGLLVVFELVVITSTGINKARYFWGGTLNFKSNIVR